MRKYASLSRASRTGVLVPASAMRAQVLHRYATSACIVLLAATFDSSITVTKHSGLANDLCIGHVAHCLGPSLTCAQATMASHKVVSSSPRKLSTRQCQCDDGPDFGPN